MWTVKLHWLHCCTSLISISCRDEIRHIYMYEKYPSLPSTNFSLRHNFIDTKNTYNVKIVEMHILASRNYTSDGSVEYTNEIWSLILLLLNYENNNIIAQYITCMYAHANQKCINVYAVIIICSKYVRRVTSRLKSLAAAAIFVRA